MPGKTVLASACMTLTLVSLLLFGCGARDYRQIVVINGDKAEVVTYGRGPRKSPKIWVPGRILAFRTTSPIPDVPGNVTGTAGHVYRVSDSMTLEEVAEFQASVPNDSLAYTYGK